LSRRPAFRHDSPTIAEEEHPKAARELPTIGERITVAIEHLIEHGQTDGNWHPTGHRSEEATAVLRALIVKTLVT
jgi:hypothetical protein